MLSRDLRRLQRAARATTRTVLSHFVLWSLKHAVDEAELVGRPMTKLAVHQAENALVRYLGAIADRGAFLYFGIESGLKLGETPVRLGSAPGHVAIVVMNMDEVCEWIMRGGARGRGWLAASEIGLDDLAR